MKMRDKDDKPNKSRTEGGVGNKIAIDLSIKQSPLIIFDRKVKIVLFLLFLVYILLSLAKIHTSSVAYWDLMFGVNEPKSLIWGRPQPVRQDEWMLSTPAIVGQYKTGFPISSMTMGYGNVPIIQGMPVKDISTLLRPNLWSYFIFDVERAFAFSWNFNILLFLISSFLVFMLLTQNNFFLSLFGTFFIFLSGSVQWWSYYIAIDMMWLNCSLISALYLLYSRRKWVLISAAILFIISFYSFVVQLYPPWQVPLGYLYLVLFLGYIFNINDFQSIKDNLKWKAIIASCAGIVLIFFMIHFYSLIKETADVMMNTAYPGKRTTNGGDLVKGKLFSDYFGIFLKAGHLPKEWLNISEASSSIMFFPIIFYGMLVEFIRTKKFNWLLILTSIYAIVILIWIIIGFPTFLSRISLLSMSPVYRTLPILGIANGILLIIYLGRKNYTEKINFSILEMSLLSVASFVFVVFVGLNINAGTSNFFSYSEIITGAILMTIVNILIHYRSKKYVLLSLMIILSFMVINNITINPLNKGLSPILKNPIVLATKDIYKNDPAGRWAVFGNQKISNLLKANGLNVFNGVKVVPILKEMSILDPTAKYKEIYNRYAHINLYYHNDVGDNVYFQLNENETVNDNYTIIIDPCSEKLKKLGVKYILFTQKPTLPETRCMTLIKDINGMFIFKRNE